LPNLGQFILQQQKCEGLIGEVSTFQEVKNMLVFGLAGIAPENALYLLYSTEKQG